MFATLVIFCHFGNFLHNLVALFGNFLTNLVALFGHIHFIDHVSTSINSLLTVLRRGNAFWLLLKFFGTFWQLLWPIFIPGQFVISPYSNIFWLVHLCDFGTFCNNLVALFGEFLPNLVTLFAKSGSTFWPHQLFTVHGSTSLNSLLSVLSTYKVKCILAFFGIS